MWYSYFPVVPTRLTRELKLKVQWRLTAFMVICCVVNIHLECTTKGAVAGLSLLVVDCVDHLVQPSTIFFLKDYQDKWGSLSFRMHVPHNWSHSFFSRKRHHALNLLWIAAKLRTDAQNAEQWFWQFEVSVNHHLPQRIMSFSAHSSIIILFVDQAWNLPETGLWK